MQAHIFYVYTREGVLMQEFVTQLGAWEYFHNHSRAYAIYQGVDLLEVKDGK